MKLKYATATVYGLSAVGLLMTGALIGLVIVPTLGEVRALGDKLVRAQTDLQAQYDDRKRLLTYAAELQKNRETLATLAKQFVPEGGELDFITGIETVAARNGTEEHLRLTDETLPGAAEVQTGFELSLNGPYHHVMQTIVDLERMPTLMLFKAVSLHPGPAAGADTSVSVVLQGVVARPPRGL